MKRLPVVAAALVALLAPAVGQAHPHIWIQQVVRVTAKDGKYTALEIEWRFDPYASEIEIPPIDEDGDGKFSEREIKLLADDTMPELAKDGFMTWLNVGGKDIRPPKLTSFTARIDDPASFMLPDWDRSAGDKTGMPMPPNKRAGELPGPRNRAPRNLVYVMRFVLPQPTKVISVTTYDSEDFVRIEVDKKSVQQGCTLAKHPTYKAEFIRGYPVYADIVTCRLP